MSSEKAHARPATTHERILPPYPQEALLISAIPQMSAGRLICTSVGMAQFALEAARAMPHADVSCTYFDLYRANLARAHWPDLPPKLLIDCAPDLPDGEADVVALPFPAGGEADLTRDLIQSAHTRLRLSGKLYTSTDNPHDIWLRDQLAKLFRKLDRNTSPTGTLYVCTKTEPLKRQKDYSCEFAFRNSGHLFRAFSRPGVFSHRRVDPGARHLMNEMQITPGARVLDIGCGAGIVALAAAARGPVRVHAVDSNSRAIQCTQRGAGLNGLQNLTTELNATGNYAAAGTYDLALANPPYYSSFRIAQHFLTAGHESLRPGGKILVVTKHPDWYQQNMPDMYNNVKINERKGYYIVEGTK